MDSSHEDKFTAVSFKCFSPLCTDRMQRMMRARRRRHQAEGVQKRQFQNERRLLGNCLNATTHVLQKGFGVVPNGGTAIQHEQEV